MVNLLLHHYPGLSEWDIRGMSLRRIRQKIEDIPYVSPHFETPKEEPLPQSVRSTTAPEESMPPAHMTPAQRKMFERVGRIQTR